MSLDIQLLRDNFELVLHRDQNFPRRFYEILFERHPEAKPLFRRNTPGAQSAMLAETLMAVLDHLEDAEWLRRHLGELGAKHVEYGVTKPMYDWVGDAMISALAEVSAGDWTHAHLRAWTAAFEVVVSLMLAPVDRPGEDTG